VHIFNLSQNKREPLCSQKVVTKARLTNVSFNSNDYILIAGDDRGQVHSLKLSPNLRQLHSADENGDEEGIQKKRLTRVLSTINKKYAT
jgi:dynein intermediate chain 1